MIKHLHLLWRTLPQGLRRTLYEKATAFLTHEANLGGATPRSPSRPLIVVGALSAPSGLGEFSRLILRGACAVGGHVSAIDLSGALMQQSVISVPTLPPACPGPGTVLLVVQPPNVAHALMLLGNSFLKDKRLVGCWAWDLEVVPETWKRQARLVHEVAAPSRFCQAAFAKAFRCDVRFLPPPIADASMELRHARAGPVTFGAALDLGSTAARKNPMAVLKAFALAFGAHSEVRLKLKIRDTRSDRVAMAAIQDFVDRFSASIELEIADLPPNKLAAWWRDVDVLVSLHRSEGLGLWPAEAMLRAIPVIATAWSATHEFIDEKNGWPVAAVLIETVDDTGRYRLPGAVWAEPDIHAAAQAMRQATNRCLVEAKGACAQATMAERFSNANFERYLFEGP